MEPVVLASWPPRQVLKCPELIGRHSESLSAEEQELRAGRHPHLVAGRHKRVPLAITWATHERQGRRREPAERRHVEHARVTAQRLVAAPAAEHDHMISEHACRMHGPGRGHVAEHASGYPPPVCEYVQVVAHLGAVVTTKDNERELLVLAPFDRNRRMACTCRW